MFGRRKHWEDAIATVISCSRGDHQIWKVGSTDWGKCDLVVDVYPQGSPPFRAPTTQTFALYRMPSPGDQIRARFDPASHEVDLQIKDDARYDPQAHQAVAAQAAWDERQRNLAAPPGTPPARAGGTSGPGNIGSAFGLDPELQELMRLMEDEQRNPPPG